MGCHWKTSLIGSVAIKTDNRRSQDRSNERQRINLRTPLRYSSDPLGVLRSAYYLFLELMAVCKLDLRAH